MECTKRGHHHYTSSSLYAWWTIHQKGFSSIAYSICRSQSETMGPIVNRRSFAIEKKTNEHNFSHTSSIFLSVPLFRCPLQIFEKWEEEKKQLYSWTIVWHACGNEVNRKLRTGLNTIISKCYSPHARIYSRYIRFWSQRRTLHTRAFKWFSMDGNVLAFCNARQQIVEWNRCKHTYLNEPGKRKNLLSFYFLLRSGAETLAAADTFIQIEK